MPFRKIGTWHGRLAALAASGVLASCSGGPSAAQLAASTLSLSRIGPSVPGMGAGSFIAIMPDGTATFDDGPSHDVAGAPIYAPQLRVSADCRPALIRAIVAARLAGIAQAEAPRVGGGEEVVTARGPGVSLKVSRASAPFDDWPRMQTVADAFDACSAQATPVTGQP